MVLFGNLTGSPVKLSWCLDGGILFVFLTLCMGVWPACMSVTHNLVWYPGKPQEGVLLPENGANDSCELPCGC